MNGKNVFQILQTKKAGQWIGFLLFVICGILAAEAVRLCSGGDIWYDELFTMGLSSRSLKEMVGFTARDVHPPFYYLYVKLLQEISGMFAQENHLIMVGKIGSALPFVLLLFYAATIIRKRFGMLTAGIFSFCIFTMPQLSQYTTEIRMYSLALFLVTAAFLHSYEIICGKERDWIFLTIYGILAAYTHYFACVAVEAIYLYLLFWFFKTGQLKEKEKKWLVCVAISVLSYIPWMFAVVSQVSQVKDNYWILPLTLRSIGGCVKFLLKPAFRNETWNVAAAVLLFAVYGLVFLLAFYKDRIALRKEEKAFAAAGLFVLLWLVAFGFAASFFIRPVFIYRYMLPAMGCFWLCFSVLIGRLQKQNAVFLPILLLLLAMGFADYRSFREEELWKQEQMSHTLEVLREIEEEDKIIFNFNHVQGILGYYLPENKTYLWKEEPEALIKEMFGKKYAAADIEEVKAWLCKGSKVWFVGSGNAREELIGEWRENGLTVTEEASCLVERYWFNLYSVKLAVDCETQ